MPDYSSPIYSKILRTIEMNYSKSLYIEQVFPVIEFVLNSKKASISELAQLSIEVFCNYLDINSTLKTTSIHSIYEKHLQKEHKLISIATTEGATDYHNAIGGINLYRKEGFTKHSINLKFLQSFLFETLILMRIIYLSIQLLT